MAGFVSEPGEPQMGSSVKQIECYNPRPMTIQRLIRLVAVLLIVALAVAYAWISFPSTREDKSRLLDFSEFYAAGQIVRQGLGRNLYDLKVQAEFQLQVAPVHAFYLRPPFEALIFVPLTYLGYRAAYITWLAISLAMLLVAAHLIRKDTKILDALLQYARGIPVDFGLLFVLFLTFAPTLNCLLIGQDSVLMLVIYTLVFHALKRGQERKAGAILACGLFKFHLVLPFVIVFALRRRGSLLLGFTAMVFVLITISILVCGPTVILSYPGMFLNPGYRKLMSFQPEYAANIHGLVYLLGGDEIPALASGALVGLLSAIVLWVTAKNWHEHQFELCFSATVIATLLTGFHAFLYDLSLLLLPLAIVCSEMLKRNLLLKNSTINVALVILFVPPIHHVLAVYHVYALMSIVLLVLFAGVIRLVVCHPLQLSLEACTEKR